MNAGQSSDQCRDAGQETTLGGDTMSSEPLSEKPDGASSTTPPQLPPLPGAVRFRFLIFWLTAIAAVVLLIGGFALEVLTGGREILPAFVVAVGLFVFLAPISIVSRFIARGLLKGQWWAVRAALLLDGFVIIVGTALLTLNVLSFSLPGESVPPVSWASVVTIVAVAFTGQAGYVLSRIWRWRFAWFASGAVVPVLLGLGVVAPLVAGSYPSKHVAPLLVYAQQHWFDLPRHYRMEVVQHERENADGGAAGHADYVSLRTENFEWTINDSDQVHGSDGRWHFPGGQAAATCKLNPAVAPGNKSVTSVEEARSRKCTGQKRGALAPSPPARARARYSGDTCASVPRQPTRNLTTTGLRARPFPRTLPFERRYAKVHPALQRLGPLCGPARAPSSCGSNSSGSI